MAEKPHSKRNIFRIEASNGLQIRFVIRGETYSEFFSFSDYESEEATLEAAKERRDEIEDILADERTGQRSYVKLEAQENNNSGIPGVNLREKTERSGNTTLHWATNWTNSDGNLVTRTRSINKYGPKDALIRVIRLRVEGLLKLKSEIDNYPAQNQIEVLNDKYRSIISFLESLDGKEEDLFMEMMTDPDVEETEKERRVNSRIGQASFRESIIQFWDGKCCVTGSEKLLVASHIKPWNESTNTERMDPYNGLLLSPVYDKAFDRGLITFSDSGEICISDDFREDAHHLGVSEDDTIKEISSRHVDYLRYHWKNIFVEKYS
jgi:predicted restriction endonuclease